MKGFQNDSDHLELKNNYKGFWSKNLSMLQKNLSSCILSKDFGLVF